MHLNVAAVAEIRKICTVATQKAWGRYVHQGTNSKRGPSISFKENLEGGNVSVLIIKSLTLH